MIHSEKQQVLSDGLESLAEQFRESALDWLTEAHVDREAGLVRNVAILGPVSRNGYRYTTEAMQSATALYDGSPVFVDHAGGMCEQQASDSKSQEPKAKSSSQLALSSLAHPTRSLRDYAGKVVAARFENDRVRGDLHLFGPNADWLLPLIEASPSDIGMSHVVLARRNTAGDLVDRIEKVLSVDIVAFPATVSSFREGSGRCSVASGRSEEFRTTHNQSPTTDHCPTITALIEQSTLPPAGRTAGLAALLQSCPDPRRMLQLLEAYWREALAESPSSRERESVLAVGARPAVKQALINAIRGK